MQKNLIFSLLVVLATVLFSNCSKDDQNDTNSSKDDQNDTNSYKGENKKVRFDGIYFQSNGSGDNYYLRFYGDKTVIDVSSSGTPSQVVKWFNRDLKGLAIGTYSIEKDSIFFTTTMPGYGDLNYRGLIVNDGNELQFIIYSPVIKKTSYKSFKFLPIIY